jgi:molybdate transport system ATP-binding protein
MLEAEVTGRIGPLNVDVRLQAEPGATLVLVGRSGAGKTSILDLVAGLRVPARGRIAIDGAAYFDAGRGVDVPAHLRPIGYVLQEYVLFPHLSVFENVAFGLRAQRRRGARVRRQVEEMLESLGIASLARRRPGHLSGGERQRVALARALVLEPRVLLLDEPLASLDAQTRRAVRTELRRILARLTCATLLVTHSPFEAMLFGERIAVVERGRITQLGTRQTLLSHPRSRYVAELLGVNLFHGRTRTRGDLGLVEVDTGQGTVRVADGRVGEDVFVAIDPRDITLHESAPGGTAQNALSGRIVEVVPEPPAGERVRVVIDSRPPLVAEVTAEAVRQLGLREGRCVHASFKATAARAYR